MIETGSPKNENYGTRPAPDVSVIIVNWNLRDFLQRCLGSVRNFNGGHVVETIVVDNGSRDGSAEMVASKFPEATLINNDDNAGFARACNQGMKAAGGRYFFLLNNDAELFEGALPALAGFLDAHPHAGACGPRVVNADGTLQVFSKGYYPSILRMAGQLFLPGGLGHPGGRSLGLYEYVDGGEIREFDWLSGCALLVRREVVEKVGPFDAEVFMYCEDIDWCYRMRQAGWGVVNIPRATVLHFGGQSMKLQQGVTVGSHAAGLAAFYSRYHSRPAAAMFRAMLSAGYAVKAIGWMIGALFGRREGLDKIKRLLSRGRKRSAK